MTDTTAASPPVPAEKRPPTIGNHATVRTIADGGLATVFEAIRPGSGQAVAIKLMKPGLPKPVDAAERLIREGATMQRLESPRILRVIECGEHDNRPFLVLELAAGGSLSPRLVAGVARDPWTMSRIVDETAEAVTHLHEHGVVHRDLHPGNLMVRANPSALGTNAPQTNGSSEPETSGFLLAEHEDIVLGDFDIAVDLDDHHGRLRSCGTPRFRAPEQMKATTPVTSTADTYALTAIAWALASGSSPPMPDEVAVAVAAIPPWWADVITTGMAADPDRRFPDVSTWHEAVRSAISTDLEQAGHDPLS